MELLEIISLNWPAAVCLILGFVCVTIELFTPGFGVPGISGLALLLIGVIVAADSLLEGLLLTIIIVLVLCLLFAIAMRSALKEAARRDDGFTSGADLNFFLGHEGVVTTMLRPVGTADFEGVKLEVLAEGECIEAGVRVRVVKVEGRKIVVRPV